MEISIYTRKEKLTADEEAELCGITKYFFSETGDKERSVRTDIWVPRPLLAEFRNFLKKTKTIYGKNGHAASAAALYLRWQKGEVNVVEVRK